MALYHVCEFGIGRTFEKASKESLNVVFSAAVQFFAGSEYRQQFAPGLVPQFNQSLFHVNISKGAGRLAVDKELCLCSLAQTFFEHFLQQLNACGC